MALIFSTASQAWTFATILPMIIGHKVSEEDLHWECYLLLLQIVQYSLANRSSSSDFFRVLSRDAHLAKDALYDPSAEPNFEVRSCSVIMYM